MELEKEWKQGRDKSTQEDYFSKMTKKKGKKSTYTLY